MYLGIVADTMHALVCKIVRILFEIVSLMENLELQRSTESVDAARLHQAALLAGNPRRLDQSPTGNPYLHGHFSSLRTASGVGLHSIDAEERVDAQHDIWLEPGISLSVLLEGSVRFTLNGQHYHYEATVNQARAFAMLVPRRSAWTRQLKAGNRLRKTNIFLPESWLKERQHLSQHYQNLFESLSIQPARAFQWQASNTTSQCAEKILDTQQRAQGDDFLNEAYALELLASVFATLSQQLSLSPAFSQDRLAENIRRYLEKEIIHNPDCLRPQLKQMAKQLGASVSSMQRSFKLASDQTIFEYVRQRKLTLAKEALIINKTTIVEAAYKAGYSHTSNFSKAFKDEFGISPGACLAMSG